jgi:hypothetical protein
VIFSHFVSLVLFSILTSIVFATLLRDDMVSRLRFGLVLFGSFLLSAVAIGWVMYPFPG